MGVLSFFLVKSINYTINTLSANQETHQEVVTLQPRDGDVIIHEDGNYKLLQLIKIEDIEFTPVLQETRYPKEYNVENRVDIFKENIEEDWTGRVSFGYTLEKISINADKIMNLYNNIKSIVAYVDFYESDDITTIEKLSDEDYFKITIFEEGTEHITNTAINSSSNKTYVTHDKSLIFINNGVNYAKLRIEIVYKINNMTFSSTILSDTWLTIKED